MEGTIAAENVAVELNPSLMSDEELEQKLAEPTDEVDNSADKKTDGKEEKETKSTAAKEETGDTKESEKTDKSEDKAAETEKLTDNEKLQAAEKRHEEDQKMIGRQSNETGNLRKQVATLTEALKKATEDTLGDIGDDVPLTKAQVAAMVSKKENEEAAQKEKLAKNKAVIQAAVPDLNELVDDIVELARQDGEPEEALSRFKADPYIAPSGSLINYARVAKEQRKVAVLETENADLKKKLSDLPDNIANAAKSNSKLTGKISSETKTIAEVDPQRLPEMSDEELDTALEDAKNRAK
jgi:hypothetical protein